MWIILTLETLNNTKTHNDGGLKIKGQLLRLILDLLKVMMTLNK